MSGLEIPALVIGIVPLVIEAIKVYGATKEKIYAYRNAFSEALRLGKRLQQYETIFHLLCRRLLKLGGFTGSVDDLISEESLSNIIAGLEVVLKSKLQGAVYQSCISFVTEISETTRKIAEGLEEYGPINTQKDSERIKASICGTDLKVRSRVKMVFDKPKIEARLKTLRKANYDFQGLLTQVVAHEHDLKLAQLTSERDEVPTEYKQINEASHALYKAIASSCTCNGGSGGEHLFSFCLTSSIVKDGIDFDVSIDRADRGSDASQKDETSLRNIEDTRRGWLRIRTPATIGMKRTCVGETERKVSKAPKHYAARTKSSPKRNWPSNERTGDELKSTKSYMMSEVEMQLYASFCEHLIAEAKKYNTEKTAARGVFECNCHGFTTFPVPWQSESDFLSKYQPNRVKILDAIELGTRENMAFSPLFRYKLARQLAIGVLQYHSTGWLNDQWRLRDYALFVDLDEPWSEKGTRTLHLDAKVQFSEKEKTDRAEPGSLAVIRYGVNNMDLFSLGIALLELGFRKRIEDLTEADGDPVYTARELSRTYSPLGPRYKRIVQRCLQGTFCEETSLAKSKLQDAVYQKVVRELEEMIASLDVED